MDTTMAGPSGDLHLPPPPPYVFPARSSPSISPSSPSRHLSTYGAISRSDSTPYYCYRPQRIRVVNGPCCWNFCVCPQGSCVTTSPGHADFCDCGHAMADHDEYAAPAKSPPARIVKDLDIVSPVAERTDLVQEIFERLRQFAIVRINATPASGKTTLMKLMIRHLLRTPGHEPAYKLTGWESDEVKMAGGWANYLEKRTGVHGDNWISHSAYLFIDEAQQTYWDTELWAALFKEITPFSKCRVLLLTSYGSPNQAGEEFPNPRFRTTPMVFHAAQHISLKPDDSVRPNFRPVGLLLSEHETIKLVGDCMKFRHSSAFTGAITDSFKHGVWEITQGHAGLTASFCEILAGSAGSNKLHPYRHSDLHRETITDVVFKDPVWLLQQLRYSRFARGLPTGNVLQNPTVAKVLKRAVLSTDGLMKSSFSINSAEAEALHFVWAQGWLLAQSAGNDTRYIFPTAVHQWYCSCVYAPIYGNTKTLACGSPLALVRDVVRRFNPCQLSMPQRSMDCDIPPLEDHYSKEFYRCIDEVLKGRLVVSPEFMVNCGTQAGSLDFFIPDMAWGIELVRNNDRIPEHLARFEPKGQYHRLVEQRNMEEWIVLNFTTKRPSKRRTEYDGRLYHLVFTDDFKSVEILDANLEQESSFYLLENGSYSFLS
ncbi:hypothetical protein BJX96DRAFT_8757 [Aspergillus floccosus]